MTEVGHTTKMRQRIRRKVVNIHTKRRLLPSIDAMMAIICYRYIGFGSIPFLDFFRSSVRDEKEANLLASSKSPCQSNAI